VDNGVPWGSWGDLPTDLALWLIGLGMSVDWNPPRRPQDNGVVERSQGTAKRWAEPGVCATAEELQRRLEEMDVIQRQEYPSLRGRSRLETFPELAHSGRVYTPAWERAHWSLAAVAAHLAGYAVPRRVNQSGTVSVYNRNHYVRNIYMGKTVYVMFDPEALEWIFVDEKGQQLPAGRQSVRRLESLRRPSCDFWGPSKPVICASTSRSEAPHCDAPLPTPPRPPPPVPSTPSPGVCTAPRHSSR
jgi:hypothetical protein